MEIYAELSKKDIELSEKIFSNLSSFIKISHKKGSRECFFECIDKEQVDDVIDVLDNNGINWQYNESTKILEDEDTKDNLHLFGKKEKKEKKEKQDYWWDRSNDTKT